MQEMSIIHNIVRWCLSSQGQELKRYGVNLERNHERMFSKGSKRHELEEEKKEGILSQGNKNEHMISH